MSLPLASCVELANPLNPQYVKRYKPASVVNKGKLCDQTYEVKSRRGAVDFVHNGLRVAHESRAKPYKIRFINHGSDFQVTSGTSADDIRFTRIPAGKTVIIPMEHRQIGFSATNQLEQPSVCYREPVHASLTFIGIPVEMEQAILIELYSDGF